MKHIKRFDEYQNNDIEYAFHNNVCTMLDDLASKIEKLEDRLEYIEPQDDDIPNYPPEII